MPQFMTAVSMRFPTIDQFNDDFPSWVPERGLEMVLTYSKDAYECIRFLDISISIE